MRPYSPDIFPDEKSGDDEFITDSLAVMLAAMTEAR